jgi:hypothetical protein
MARASAKVVSMNRTDHEEYDFGKETIRVGANLSYHSFAAGRPPIVWRIVAFQSRNYRGDVVDSKKRRRIVPGTDPASMYHSGSLQRWCDLVVLANYYGEEKTVGAMYVHENRRWRFLVGG